MATLENFQALRALVVRDPSKEDRIEQLEKEIRIYLADFLKEEIKTREPKTEGSVAEDFSRMILRQRQMYDKGEEDEEGEESDNEDWFDG